MSDHGQSGFSLVEVIAAVHLEGEATELAQPVLTEEQERPALATEVEMFAVASVEEAGEVRALADVEAGEGHGLLLAPSAPAALLPRRGKKVRAPFRPPLGADDREAVRWRSVTPAAG